MEIQRQNVIADYRPSGDVSQSIQQLGRAGFDDAQVRALAVFVAAAVEDAMRPFMEHMDRRFDALEWHMDQCFDAMDRRMDRWVEAMERCADDPASRMDRLGRPPRAIAGATGSSGPLVVSPQVSCD